MLCVMCGVSELAVWVLGPTVPIVFAMDKFRRSIHFQYHCVFSLARQCTEESESFAWCDGVTIVGI